ncbi:hypothetical protein AZI86_17865 [Bdellovibrio bacteriovorus]|uniref:Uncharacterized protein n=1 Tax=Bdellovibrio bacteriovorus TaxID=959 RepID=A0A150WF18_BDEBC|nr:hypothetical protein [Bdellovibrio bacteriovorus]KYG61572.1 hypothetical protein AZI86_17865 [Bdellovibrio bacteriovorus]
MKFLVIVLFALSCLSCTKKSDSVSTAHSGPHAEVINQDLPDPSADISAAPQACTKDADCGGKKCVEKVCTTAH